MTIDSRTDPVLWGHLVHYHGSLTDAHGIYRLDNDCICARSLDADDEALVHRQRRPLRFILTHPRSGHIALECVGGDSITYTEEGSQ